MLFCASVTLILQNRIQNTVTLRTAFNLFPLRLPFSFSFCIAFFPQPFLMLVKDSVFLFRKLNPPITHIKRVLFTGLTGATVHRLRQVSFVITVRAVRHTLLSQVK